jgi:carbon-monoxide dehydrogenase medium subunit
LSFGSPFFTLPEFTYHKPTEISEVLNLLKTHGDEAKIMGGGVGLLAFMKERLMSPGHVIDIKGIKQLRQLNYESGRGVKVGACVTLADLARSDVLKQRYTALHEAVSGAADPMIRGRATLVGNLCEAIPWVDSPPALIALDSTVEIVGPGGERRVNAENFVKGPVEIDLQPGEFVTHVRLPEAPNFRRSTFQKFSAGAEFSIASVAASVVLEKKRKAKLVYGAVGPAPVRSLEAEKIITEEEVTEASINRAAQEAAGSVDCVSDVLASSDYRRHLVQVLTTRALRRIFVK